MTLLSPLNLLWGLAILPVLALHLLRPKRTAVEISSTFLWREHHAPVTSAKPWQHLRVTLPLVLQCLAIALMAFGLARPTRSTVTPYGRHTVFLVDTSASMGARTEIGSSDRLGEAAELAVRLRSKLPANAIASVVSLSATPRVVLSASPSSDSFRDAVRRLKPSAGRPDVGGASLLAQGLQSVSADTSYVLISDGALESSARGLLPPLRSFHRVGETVSNLAIVGLDVQPTGGGARAAAVVRQLNPTPGQPNTAADVEFVVDGRVAQKQRVSLGSKELLVVAENLPAGDLISARLRNARGSDRLGADDERWAVAGKNNGTRILLVSPGDIDGLFLQRALESTVGAQIVARSELPEPGQSLPGGPVDLVVLDRTDLSQSLNRPVLAIAPPKGIGAITVVGSEENVAATSVRADDALVTGLDLSDVVAVRAQKIAAPDADVVIGSTRTPLAVRGRHEGQPILYFGFALQDSSLPLDIAFPVLIDRSIRELTGTATSAADIIAGQTLSFESGDVRRVISPGKRSIELDTNSSVIADEVGIWTLENRDGSTTALAVNESVAESDLRVGSVAVDGASGSATKRSRSQQPLLPWVLGGLLALLAGEWLSIRRRAGVSSGQWKAARLLRIGLAGFVLFALLSSSITRKTRDVSVVFAVDMSDSLGPAGRRAGLDLVEASLRQAPSSARAGVVLFGGNARVTAAAQRKLKLAPGVIDVDGSRTDIAGALQLAAAVSPGDAARRIVLVSDGRRTNGDELAVVEELRTQKIRLDAIGVGSSVAGDLAVTEFAGPSRVRPGEKVDLRVRVDAQAPRQTELVVRSGTTVVSRQRVSLVAGPNEFTLAVTAPGEGGQVVAFEVTVGTGADAVGQNDSAQTVFAVDGPAKVLVVEGAPGRGDALVALLIGAQVEATKVGLDRLPSLSGLSAFSSIVLVDVAQRDLSEKATQELSSAVRELGIGLVVIGGANSYGSGSYLGSPLEPLLPVVSEVPDPERRKPVSQVIVIDVSGSMSEEVDAGRTKLDLAKAAAAGSVDTLEADDRVGILAVDDGTKWIMNVQKRPSPGEARKQIGRMNIGGGTELLNSLNIAAKQLPSDNSSIRHILLLTDGFTNGPMSEIVAEAAALRKKGITVSVVGAGAEVEQDLPAVAVAGGGRYIPGNDFANLPKLFVSETEVVQRNLVTEGSFLPEVTSGSAFIRTLTSAPVLKGYQATSPRPTARTLLRVGPERDPLLATWQAGSGRVSAWTSDAGERWAAPWMGWDGASSFWAGLVKDTFSVKRPGSIQASVRDDRLVLRAEGTAGAALGATAIARVSGPDGVRDVTLARTADGSFVGDVELGQVGSFAVGVLARSGSLETPLGSTVAVRGYSSEYRPRPVEIERLAALSKRSGGRGIITPEQAFAGAGLRAGERSARLDSNILRWILLGFLLAVALSRIAMRNRLTTAMARALSSPLSRVTSPIRTRLSARKRMGTGVAFKRRSPDQASTRRVARRAEPAESTESTESTAVVVDEPKPANQDPEVAPSLGRLLDKAREERERRNT
jgi:Ca-activated chloride channel homolog